METRTVNSGNITAVVRSHFRRTPIIEKEYWKALREVYPEVEPCERAMLAIPAPDKPNDEEAIKQYEMALVPVVAEHDLGWEHIQQMQLFVPLAARLKTVSGAPFTMAQNERFIKDELAKAYEHFLMEESGDESFWQKVRVEVQSIDKPATPIEQQPGAVVSPSDKKDPLSPKRTRGGMTESASTSTT